MQNKTRNDRRVFLKSAALAGGAVTVALGVNTELAQTSAVATEIQDGPAKGYHLTPHIKQYYRLARD